MEVVDLLYIEYLLNRLYTFNRILVICQRNAYNIIMFRIKNVRGSTVAKNTNFSPAIPQPKLVKQSHIPANGKPNLNMVQLSNHLSVHPHGNKIIQTKNNNNKQIKLTNDGKISHGNVNMSKVKSIEQNQKKNMLRPASKARNYHKVPNLLKQQKKVNNKSKKNENQLIQKVAQKESENTLNQKTKQTKYTTNSNNNLGQNLQKKHQFIQRSSQKQQPIFQQQSNSLWTQNNKQIQMQKQKQNQKKQKQKQGNAENHPKQMRGYDEQKQIQQAQIKQRKRKFRQQQQIQDRRRQQQAKQQIERIMKRKKQRQQRLLRQKKEEDQRQQALNKLMAMHNNKNNDSNSMGGIMYTNDPLAHFQFTDLIMDAQISKILKTSFNHFPSGNAIEAKKQQLRRINQSYIMIKNDPENQRLSQGLKNFRVELFNQIGQLIMQDQNNGYGVPNFAVIEGDARNGRINEEVTLMRGIPKQKIESVTIKRKCKVTQQCSICLEDIKIGQSYNQFPCKHAFHERCTQDWVQLTANCPSCRKNLKF